MAMTSERFESELDALIRTWATSVDAYIEEWSAYDSEEQVYHIEDFGCQVARQADIEEYTRTHPLTPEQTAKLHRLRDLISDKCARLTELGFRVRPLARSGERAA